jgi:predicted phage replisome organizer
VREVKWVKITTDMFDNRKIKHLRRLPDGNNIVLIWIMLLTMAGRCNSGGKIFLTENIPYDAKMLADELDFKENTVAAALKNLEQLDMIAVDNGFYTIVGWGEYQNVDGMDKVREQTRKRVAEFKKNKKSQAGNVTSNAEVTHGNVTGNTEVTQGNATEEEREEEKEYNTLSISACTRDAPTKAPYFTPPNIEEIREYCVSRNNNVNPEQFYDFYESKGWMVGNARMKDWKAAVRTWERRSERAPATAQKHKGSFDTDDFFQAALNRKFYDWEVDKNEQQPMLESESMP